MRDSKQVPRPAPGNLGCPHCSSIERFGISWSDAFFLIFRRKHLGFRYSPFQASGGCTDIVIGAEFCVNLRLTVLHLAMFHDFSLASVSGSVFSENTNPELDLKVKRVTERLSENLHIVANEPSLALYRIQEHVRKSLPQLVDERHRVDDIHRIVKGACYDTEYAIGAVKAMKNSEANFNNIQELLKNSMFMKQQIQYETSRRDRDRLNPSMYHLRQKTLDIPGGGKENDDVFTTSASVDHFPRIGSRTKLDRRLRSSSVDTPREHSRKSDRH